MFETLRTLFSDDNEVLKPRHCTVHAAAETDAGRARKENQDSVYIRVESLYALALVADGMGGSQGGKTASEIASRVVPEVYGDGGGSPSRALRKSLETASREIYEHSLRDKTLEGMGTTCVALVVQDALAWVAWVGDSRLYLIRDGQMFQMTEDHSLVQEMVREGLLTAAEAGDHEERNVVTRALGSHKEVEVSVWEEPYPVRPGDRFLLCSDGLHDTLPQEELAGIASKSQVGLACAALVAAANLRGGPDNISAVLVEIAS